MLGYALLACAGIAAVDEYRGSHASLPVAEAKEPATTQAAAAVAPLHYYSMQAGDEYGYERDVSDDQKQAGIAASPLVMIRFAGEKKGRYQIFSSSGNLRTVFDCEKPCDFIRVRTFVDGDEAAVDHMRRVKGSIAYYAMEDAMQGRLAQHFIMRKGQRLTLWYSD